ncbi:hypothetical protein ACQ4LE_009868 [Meloidogyne hapla]|uniref:Uncharacterized protein n=1 Tax=Meloidogyne hapla TaxID=6305 RepID=A0A1I8B377_MELHA
MAENFEQKEQVSDQDLLVDRNEFRKNQFDAFKHNFLDSFDEAGYAKLEHLVLDPKIKKEVVNTARRLQKAKISLKIIESKNPQTISPILEKIDEIFTNLIENSKQSSEFSTKNIKLPEYDKRDMEFLLGKNKEEKEEKVEENEQNPLKWLCKSNEDFEKKIIELIGAAELLLNEWREIRNYYKND